MSVVPRPADINGDSTVDVLDLLAVIGAWGPCVPGTICTADVNFDCTVNVLDLLAVTGAWGPCPEEFQGFSGPSYLPPDSIQECFDQFSNDPEKLVECILLLQSSEEQ